MTSESNLSSICGRCFRPVLPSTGGFILSCCDFLCFGCAKTTSPENVSSCPACGKQGVGALSLSENLPEEVMSSMSDTSADIVALKGAMDFQIKYYKQTMKKMIGRITMLNKENAQLKGIIQNGSARTSQQNGDQRQPQTNQFFQSNGQQRPQTSLSTMLSKPINAATLPPSSLGKRPDTSQAGMRPAGQGAAHSVHFQAPAGQGPPAKRPQTTQAHSAAPGGPVPSRGSFQRAVEESRPVMPGGVPGPVSAASGQFSQLPPVRLQSEAQRSPQTSPYPQHSPVRAPFAEPTTEENMWGFGGPGAADPSGTYPHTVTPAVVMPPPAPERLSTPAPSNQYQVQANRSPSFMTPSRLRSPHLPVARGSSGGNGRPGSGSGVGLNGRPGSGSGARGPANPLQGMSVTLSQNQMPPPYGALMGRPGTMS